jgi:hypothetical protein
VYIKEIFSFKWLHISVMVYSILEQPAAAEVSSSILATLTQCQFSSISHNHNANPPPQKLLANPSLYRGNRGNALMSRAYLVQWLSLGLWHSFCSFFLWIWLYQARHRPL